MINIRIGLYSIYKRIINTVYVYFKHIKEVVVFVLAVVVVVVVIVGGGGVVVTMIKAMIL